MVEKEGIIETLKEGMDDRQVTSKNPKTMMVEAATTQKTKGEVDGPPIFRR